MSQLTPACMLTTSIAACILVVACSAPSTTSPTPATIAKASATPAQAALPTNTPLPPAPTATPASTATPAFDFGKLVGVWNVRDVYVLFTPDGRFSVAGSIARFVEGAAPATIIVEGDLVKFYDEPGCGDNDVGVYRITFSETGDRHTLTLVDDPCEWRKGGPVPAASTYRKLEPSVLPGRYTSEVTQAEAESSGGGDLLNYVGAWELQLDEDESFVLLQGDQPVATGRYLSAGILFTLTHDGVCPRAGNAVYKAVVDEVGVTFYPDFSLTREYDCKEMLLILTRHPWVEN